MGGGISKLSFITSILLCFLWKFLLRALVSSWLILIREISVQSVKSVYNFLHTPHSTLLHKKRLHRLGLHFTTGGCGCHADEVGTGGKQFRVPSEDKFTCFVEAFGDLAYH